MCVTITSGTALCRGSIGAIYMHDFSGLRPAARGLGLCGFGPQSTLSRNALAIDKHPQLTVLEAGPLFVLRQWGSDDDGNLVVGGGFLGEVYAQVFVGQLGLGEGVAALGKAQVGGGVGPERFAVGEQEVKGAVRCNASCELAQSAT